jgi:hypothetical protein
MKLFIAIITAICLGCIPYIGQAQITDHEKMMESQGMPGSGANDCFKHSMEQAIELQQINVKESSRRSEQMDKEIMEQMEHARMCLQEAGVPGGGKRPRDKQMQCADDWLDRSIALHRKHMDNPSTKTDASQKELLKEMRRSYNCTGPARTISGEK